MSTDRTDVDTSPPHAPAGAASRSPDGVRACCGPASIVAAALAGLLSGPAGAAGATAQCPASTPTRDVQAFMSGEVLMCNIAALAPPSCPSTHPTYQVRSGRDTCHVASTKPLPQGPSVVQPVCPAHMELKVDWKAEPRDRCRGLLSASYTPAAAAGQL